MNNNETRNRERKARRKLAKEGYTLQKYRGTIDPYSVGNYRIINSNNVIATSDRFDMTLEDIERFANE